MLVKIAEALSLEIHDLFLPANPSLCDVIGPSAGTRDAAWKKFLPNRRLHTRLGQHGDGTVRAA